MDRKLISISLKNYNILKTYGQAGDSFDKAITKLIQGSKK